MKRALPVLGSLLLGALLAAPAAAQPFGAWIILPGHPSHGYARVDDHPALNLTTNATIEGWVSLRDANGVGGCSSIIGKNFREAYWVGVCGTQLRGYFRGTTPTNSAATGGIVPVDRWTHFAITYGGGRQKHYINGELVLDVAKPVGITDSDDDLRIGSDVQWQFSPDGSINELRLWNVVRTQAQIRESINVAITTPQPGLVAVWRDGQHDAIGALDGVLVGAVTGFLTHPIAPNCGSTTSSQLCLHDRFSVHTRFRTGAPGTAELQASVLPCAAGCAGSGIFYFFNVANWEIMAKAINGCGLNNRWWLFSAATTNVFYRMEVMDVTAGVNKIYFNYPGPPAPAVTDTSAFATCP